MEKDEYKAQGADHIMTTVQDTVFDGAVHALSALSPAFPPTTQPPKTHGDATTSTAVRAASNILSFHVHGPSQAYTVAQIRSLLVRSFIPLLL